MLTGKRLRDRMAPLAGKLKGVAHPHRLAILYLLSHDRLEVRDIRLSTGLRPTVLAHHLALLRREGWVTRLRFGREVSYQLNPKAFADVQKLLKRTPLAQTLANSAKK